MALACFSPTAPFRMCKPITVRDGQIVVVLRMTWRHRPCVKGLGLNPKRLPARAPPKAQRALQALGFIKALYRIQRRIRGKPVQAVTSAKAWKI